MIRESVSIVVKEHTLSGTLSHAGPEPRKAVLLLHPHPLYGGDMDNPVLLALEEVFLSLDYLTLRFNFRGTQSDRASFAGPTGAVEDAEAAYSVLTHNRDLTHLGLVGYSFGGSVALKLGMTHRVDFLVTLSASVRLLNECNIGSESCTPAHSLLFHGLADIVVPHSDMQEIMRILEGSRIVGITLDGEGHFYNRSLGTVADSTRSFVREVEAQ